MRYVMGTSRQSNLENVAALLDVDDGDGGGGQQAAQVRGLHVESLGVSEAGIAPHAVEYQPP